MAEHETANAEQVPPEEPGAARRGGSDEFLMPGPTSTSNQGALRWGLSWLILSFVLMGMVGLLSLVCWWLATVTGIA